MKLLQVDSSGDAVPGETDAYGRRYSLDFECIRQERKAIVRSSWMVLTGEDSPRLMTCFEL
jgi:hypothetical protein